MTCKSAGSPWVAFIASSHMEPAEMLDIAFRYFAESSEVDSTNAVMRGSIVCVVSLYFSQK